MALDPFAPAVFAFCNRRRDRNEALVLRPIGLRVGPALGP
ncbi:transposase (plasmid) [Rhizobium rhizogenes]|nr:transposase [Rhizobium rhizogenes]QTG10255.1 transposase [Rhizobium rhizogenes]